MKEVSVTTKEASVTARNISIVVLLKVAQYPFLALFMILVPRMMGPETYGEYALLISLITIAASLVDFGGGPEVFGRFVPEFEMQRGSAQVGQFSSQMLTLKVIIDLIAVSILFPMLQLTYSDRFSSAYFVLIVVIVLVRDWQSVPYALLFGLNKLGKYTIQLPLRRALSLIFVLTLFYYFGLWGAIVSTFLVNAVLGALAFLWTRSYFHIENVGLDLSSLKPYLGFSLIFYLSWMLLNFWQRLGNLLLEYFTQDPRQIALFDIPNQIAIVALAFIGVTMDSLVPMFTKLLLTGQEAKLLRWSTLMAKYLGAVCTVFLGAFIMAGPDLVSILIGPDYRMVYPVGIILFLSSFPMIFAQLGVTFAIVYEKPRKYLIALCAAFVTFLCASILLVPKYASVGSAMATLISSVVLAVVIASYFREKLVPCLTDSFRAMSLGLILLPFLLLKGNSITNLVLTIAYMLAYISALFVSGSVSVGEVKGIFRAIRLRPDELQTSL